MQATKRGVFWTLLVLIPVLCAFAVGWRTYTDYVRQQQNHALIAAIKQDNVPGVTRALAHGADANAHDIPEDRRRLWQRLLDFLHRKTPNDATIPSALQIAVQHDLDADRPTPPETSFAIIKALHDAGAAAAGDIPKFLPEIQAYTKTIASFPFVPILDKDKLSAPRTTFDTKEFLLEHGMSAYVYAAIGAYRFHDNEYSDAIHAYRIAQLWLPNDVQIRAELAQAEEAQRVCDAVTRQLPKWPPQFYTLPPAERPLYESVHSGKFHAFSARPYPDAQGRHLWAVICGFVSEHTENNQAETIALYEEKDGHFAYLCQSDVGGRGMMSLSILHATGRPQPEIVLYWLNDQLGSFDSQLSLYEVTSGKLRCIFSQWGNGIRYLEDLRHDGRYAARDMYGCNDMTASDGPPCRSDIYAFNGREYLFADRDYPEAFQRYIVKAEKYLARYPDDYELFYSLAYIYSITGQPQKAERYYQKAERLCRAAIVKDSDANERASDRAILKRILARNPRLHD